MLTKVWLCLVFMQVVEVGGLQPSAVRIQHDGYQSYAATWLLKLYNYITTRAIQLHGYQSYTTTQLLELLELHRQYSLPDVHMLHSTIYLQSQLCRAIQSYKVTALAIIQATNYSTTSNIGAIQIYVANFFFPNALTSQRGNAI